MPKRRAANPANQAALERLEQLKERAQNTKYQHTVAKAITSLATCPTAIENRKQAIELKYVGPAIAKVIVPHEAPTRSVSRGSSAASTGSGSPSSTTARAAAPKRARPLPTTTSTSTVQKTR